MILLIDNYDSFVHNLARYFKRLGQETLVVRNDAITIADIRTLKPSAIVISPGPCTPDSSGLSLTIVQEFYREVPMLGICLGHQTVGQVLGANVVIAAEPVHGRCSPIEHDGQGLFEDLPETFNACRYHSLILERESLPDSLQVSAWLADGMVMAIRHREYPLVGVQFHPESILTESGYTILSNFLQMAHLDRPVCPLTLDHERRPVSEQVPMTTDEVITF